MDEQTKLKHVEARLADDSARNLWFGSVRADGRPHLVPLWFVWHDGKLWTCLGKGTQKYINIMRNSNVVLALEDGAKPIIVEGNATQHPTAALRDQLASHFISKYSWDFRTASDEDWVLVSVKPDKIMSW